MNQRTLLGVLSLWFLVASSPSISADGEPLKIASIEWCPQLCQDQDMRGYVTETVDMVFENSPYDLEISIYPWTRAILMVRSGQAHALLSPTKKEAPNLRYPKNQVGTQKMCFFSTADSTWRYSGLESLQGLRLGVARDTSISELDAYMRENSGFFQVMPYDHSYVEKSLKQISAGRMDAFLFTNNSVIHEIRLLGLEGKYRSSGCFSSENIYMAFSPLKSKEAEIEKMIKYFDQRMNQLNNSGRLDNILSRYQLH